MNERKSCIVLPKSVKSDSKSPWFCTTCSAMRELMTNGNAITHSEKTVQRIYCGTCDWVDLEQGVSTERRKGCRKEANLSGPCHDIHDLLEIASAFLNVL